MLNYDLPILSDIGIMKGFDDAVEDTRSKRLRNYEAMQKISKDFTDAGQEMSVEQWAEVSKNVLGPGAWLNNTAPSAATVEVLMANQKKAAANKAELMRREQVKADLEQRKIMESQALDAFAAGASTEDTYAQLVQTHGQEWADKLRPNLQRMQQKAEHDTTMTGVDFGSKMFNTTEEAQDYIANKGMHLTQWEKNGLLRGAESNQRKIEADIVKMATEQGNSTGWLDNADSEKQMRVAIRALVPNASKEYEERMVKSAMDTARAVSLKVVNQKQVDTVQAARQASATNAEQSARVITEMEIAEENRRKAEAAAIAKQYEVQIETQLRRADDLGKKPVKGKERESAEVASALSTHVFDNPEAYVTAVMNGDTETANALIAVAVPVAEHRAKAEAMGNIIRGKFKNAGEVTVSLKNAGFGMSSNTIQRFATELKRQENVANSGGRTVGRSEPVYDELGNVVGFETGYAGPSDNKMSEAAKQNAAGIRSNFVKSVAVEIKGVREAIRQNTHINATKEEMEENERSVALDRATRLATSMGVSDPAFIQKLVSDIMLEAGATRGYEAEPTPTERFVTRRNTILNDLGVNRDTAVQPGAVLPSPRLTRNFE